MKNKLKSRRGASLSIALLLFLVCVVIGGVVLTAATASGGRLSKLEESDQRYFNVTSAAQLLKSVYNEKTITIEQTLKTGVTKSTAIITGENNSFSYGASTDSDVTTEYSAAIKESGETAAAPIYSYQNFVIDEETGAYRFYELDADGNDKLDESGNKIPVEVTTAVQVPGELLKYCAYLLTFGTDESGDADGAIKANSAPMDGFHTLAFPAISQDLENIDETVVVPHPETGKDPLTTYVSATLRKDGSLFLELSDKPSTELARYKVEMLLSANMKNDASVQEVDGAPVISGNSESLEHTTIESRKTEITWKVQNIRVVKGGDTA